MKSFGFGSLLGRVAILVAAVALLLGVAGQGWAQNVDCYVEQGGAKRVASSGCEYEFQSGSTLDIQSGVTYTNAAGVTQSGTLTVTGDLVSTDLILSKQTSITVTNGAAFTPTGTYQGITAAGTVTPTITVPSAGTVLVIVNESAQTINLADSGTAKLSAAYAMGQFDSLTLVSDGTNLIELSRSDN